MWYHQKFYKIATAIILVLLIAYLSIQILPLIKAFLGLILALLLPAVFAVLLYYIFRPARNIMEKYKVPRLLAIGIIFLVIAVALTIMIVFIWPFISQQIAGFAATPREKIKDVETKTLDLMNIFNFNSVPVDQLRETLASYIQQIINFIASNLIVTISSIAQITTYIVVTPFILFYLLKDDNELSSEMYYYVGLKHKDKFRKIFHEIDTSLSSYISGQVMVALCVAFLIFIGYWIIGLKYAGLLAFFAFLFNLIPFCGPFISTIPALFIGFSQSPLMAFKVIIVVLAVHLIDMNLISPKIVGQRLNIHPVTIILLLVASFSLFGLLGAFLITPIYAVLRTIAIDFYEMQRNKSTEVP